MKKQIAIAAAVAASFALWAAVSPQTAVDKETPALTPTPPSNCAPGTASGANRTSNATDNRDGRSSWHESRVYLGGSR